MKPCLQNPLPIKDLIFLIQFEEWLCSRQIGFDHQEIKKQTIKTVIVQPYQYLPLDQIQMHKLKTLKVLRRNNIFNSELRQSTHLEGGGGSWLRQKCSFECRRSFCTSAQLALMHFLRAVRGMQHLWGAIVFRLCCNLLRLYCVVFHLRPGGRCWGQKWAEVAS